MTPDLLTSEELHALAALLKAHRRDGRATFRSVALTAGCSVSSAFLRLNALRDAGLVDWEDDRRGTLRPLVEAVR